MDERIVHERTRGDLLQLRCAWMMSAVRDTADRFSGEVGGMNGHDPPVTPPAGGGAPSTSHHDRSFYIGLISVAVAVVGVILATCLGLLQSRATLAGGGTTSGARTDPARHVTAGPPSPVTSGPSAVAGSVGPSRAPVSVPPPVTGPGVVFKSGTHTLTSKPAFSVHADKLTLDLDTDLARIFDPDSRTDAIVQLDGLGGRNGVTFARWGTSVPTLELCATKSDQDRRPDVPLEELQQGTSYCVLSSEHRHGYLTVRAIVRYDKDQSGEETKGRLKQVRLSFILWKKDRD